MKKTHLKTDSWLVAAGRPHAPGSPMNTPVLPVSNYTLGDERVYSRDSATAGWEALEEIVGGLEGGDAIAFSSGMAAAAAVFQGLPAGATVVLADDCYHGVSELASRGEQKGLWSLRSLAVDDTAAWLEAAENTDLLWLESPSNPLLKIADLATLCAAPRKPGGLLVVDNTFATPLNQRPLALGADISMHSATKFIGGHSDLLGGVLIARSSEIADRLREARTIGGATPGSLEVFLAVRGLRTLALRLERAQHNAGRVADWLESHASVAKTRYPGLSNHPGHALARKQLDGFGCIITFDMAGDAQTADRVCQSVRLIRHATSLGSVESTMERRAAVPGQEHLPPSLLRLSVGIESFDDLRSDLEQAFRSACG
jgi:cystathionine gamma-synthase